MIAAADSLPKQKVFARPSSSSFPAAAAALFGLAAAATTTTTATSPPYQTFPDKLLLDLSRLCGGCSSKEGCTGLGGRAVALRFDVVCPVFESSSRKRSMLRVV